MRDLGVQNGLFSTCPVTLGSSSNPRSCAFSTHFSVTPAQPRLCSTGSDPDKLLCLQAAPSSAPTISSYFYPIPWRGVCLSTNIGAKAGFPPAGSLDRFPWRSQLPDHYMRGLGPGLHCCQKQPLHHCWGWCEGGTSASPTNFPYTTSSCRREETWICCKNNYRLPKGLKLGWHGFPSLFISSASLYVFWQRRISAVPD